MRNGTRWFIPTVVLLLTMLIGVELGCRRGPSAPRGTHAGKEAGGPATRGEHDAPGTPASDPAQEVDDGPLSAAQLEQLARDTADYASAVEVIEQLLTEIRLAIARGTPHDAHEPMDKLDVVLKRMPVIARDSQVPRRHWQLINESAQEIRELVEQVHENIDAERPPEFEKVAERIEKAFGQLASVRG